MNQEVEISTDTESPNAFFWEFPTLSSVGSKILLSESYPVYDF